jgi:hypothetical protein
MQARDHRRRIGEALRIPGKNPEAVHVVDVDMNCIERNAPYAETTHDVLDLVGGGVTPA